METLTKAEKEFNALLTLADKLNFDASGRAGVKKINAEQEKLEEEENDRLEKDQYQEWLVNANIIERSESKDFHHFDHIKYDACFNKSRVNWLIRAHKGRLNNLKKSLKSNINSKNLGAYFSSGQRKNRWANVLCGLPYANLLENNTSLVDLLTTQKARTDFINSSLDANKLVKTQRLLKKDALASDKEWALIGNYLMILSEKWDYTWNKYGGNNKLLWRCASFYNKKGQKVKEVDIKLFKGFWFLRVINESGLFSPKKYKNITKSIQLESLAQVKKLKKEQGFSIYKLSIFGEHWQYCASNGKTHYHHVNLNNAIQGLEHKIKEKTPELFLNEKMVTWKLGKKLGFCESGMNSFCSAFDLDPDQSYSPKELIIIIKKVGKDKAAPFLSELDVLAKHFKIKTVLS